ncbi:MAG: hypothetical protein DLM60_23695 [Pseudonocardiales bacterium]|nr:MAG: hypothetical protein DLM60_23695 [Pseudonocardiales bacterium]
MLDTVLDMELGAVATTRRVAGVTACVADWISAACDGGDCHGGSRSSWWRDGVLSLESAVG